MAGTVWPELRALHVTEGAAGAVNRTVRTLHHGAEKGQAETGRAAERRRRKAS